MISPDFSLGRPDCYDLLPVKIGCASKLDRRRPGRAVRAVEAVVQHILFAVPQAMHLDAAGIGILHQTANISILARADRLDGEPSDADVGIILAELLQLVQAP